MQTQISMALSVCTSDIAIDMALISVSAYDDCIWETLQEHGSDHVPCLSMVRRKRNWVRKKVMRAFTYLLLGAIILSKLDQ